MKDATISRRAALSLLGLAAAFGLAMPMTSEAEAQQTGATSDEKTTGTERRQERRVAALGWRPREQQVLAARSD